MTDYYFYASYIILEKHYRTWDPHLCHWGKFHIIPYACVYGPHDYLLTWMYKHFHYYLMRLLLDVHLYDVLMLSHDLYFVLEIFMKGAIQAMESWYCTVSILGETSSMGN